MFDNKKIFYIILSITSGMIIAAVVIGGKVMMDLKSKTQQDTSALGAATGEDNDRTVLANVGKHLVLPYEQPKIVTIANVDDLKRDQPFFTQAKNGDKLLVYSTRVILYNPELDKIIDIAQIRIDQSPTPTQ